MSPALAALTLLAAAPPDDGPRPVRTLTDGPVNLRDVVLSPDGRLAAARGWDDQARVWEVATGRLVRRIDVRPRDLEFLLFAPDNRTLLVVADGSPFRARVGPRQRSGALSAAGPPASVAGAAAGLVARRRVAG